MTTPATVVRLDDVEPVTWANGEAGRFLLRAADTGGAYSFYEIRLPAGEGSVRHLHEQMDETFYVLSGELAVTVADTVHTARAGVLVHAPRGVPHSFRNPTDRPTRMLCIASPGGIEVFFEGLAGLMAQDPPAGPEQLRELAGEHRIVTFPDLVPAAVP